MHLRHENSNLRGAFVRLTKDRRVINAEVFFRLLEGTKLNTSCSRFNRWFGNSVVVDEKNNPLIVYHGTNVGKNFGAFRIPQTEDDLESTGEDSGLGVFFSNNPFLASQFSIKPGTQGLLGSGGRLDSKSKLVAAYLKIENPHVVSPASSREDAYLSFTRFLKEKGIDGFIYRKELERIGHDGVIINKSRFRLSEAYNIYVVFKSTQIRPALKMTANRKSK